MPNRIIKESICTSENLDNLTSDEEVFFYRLLVVCDDYGIFFANPSILRAKCFPLRIDKIKDRDIDKWTTSLVNARLIFLYDYEGRQYLKLSKWENHQQVRATKSKYPTPDMEGVRIISVDNNGNQLIENAPVFVSVSDSSNRDKHSYASNVKMKEEEYLKLCEEFGEHVISGKIEDLNNWKGGKGKTTKDDYLTIRAWIRKDAKENRQSSKPNQPDNVTKAW